MWSKARNMLTANEDEVLKAKPVTVRSSSFCAMQETYHYAPSISLSYFFLTLAGHHQGERWIKRNVCLCWTLPYQPHESESIFWCARTRPIENHLPPIQQRYSPYNIVEAPLPPGHNLDVSAFHMLLSLTKVQMITATSLRWNIFSQRRLSAKSLTLR